MCIVSNIGNGWDTYPTAPWKNPTPVNPLNPEGIAPPVNQFGWPPLVTIDPKVLEQFQAVIKRLDEIEKALGIVDCKDEKKEAFLNELQALIDKYKAEGKE